MNLLSYILYTGDIGGFLLWAVGVLVVWAIAWAIVRQLELPPLALKIVMIVGLLALLLFAIDFFFGPGVRGGVYIR